MFRQCLHECMHMKARKINSFNINVNNVNKLYIEEKNKEYKEYKGIA